MLKRRTFHMIAILLLAFLWHGQSVAAPEGVEIKLENNRLSVTANQVGLGRLLRLIGNVTGYEPSVPERLAQRPVSVRCTDLAVNEAIKKIFEGLPIDYVLTPGKLIVTGVSQPFTEPVGPPPTAAGVPSELLAVKPPSTWGSPTDLFPRKAENTAPGTPQ
jgi:hypothetical protein